MSPMSEDTLDEILCELNVALDAVLDRPEAHASILLAITILEDYR